MKRGYSRESDQQMLVKELTERLAEGKRLEERKLEGPGRHTAARRQIPAPLYMCTRDPQERPHFREEKSEVQRS